MTVAPGTPDLYRYLFPALAATLAISLVAGLTSGCGCGGLSREAMRAFRAGCPCEPGEDDGADSAGSYDDEGCGRSYEHMRCECGVAPPEDPGDSSTGGTSGTEGSTTTDDTGDACDEQTPVTLYLSADDSNSMSSPVQARAAAPRAPRPRTTTGST